MQPQLKKTRNVLSPSFKVNDREVLQIAPAERWVERAARRSGAKYPWSSLVLSTICCIMTGIAATGQDTSWNPVLVVSALTSGIGAFGMLFRAMKREEQRKKIQFGIVTHKYRAQFVTSENFSYQVGVESIKGFGFGIPWEKRVEFFARRDVIDADLYLDGVKGAITLQTYIERSHNFEQTIVRAAEEVFQLDLSSLIDDANQRRIERTKEAIAVTQRALANTQHQASTMEVLLQDLNASLLK